MGEAEAERGFSGPVGRTTCSHLVRYRLARAPIGSRLRLVSDHDLVVKPADRALRTAENLVYTGAGVLLLGGAVIVLGIAAYHLIVDIGAGTGQAIEGALDGLLLVFILLELLAGVRATMTTHELVAEPFLIVGIIASIKEIVVVTLQTKKSRGVNDAAFTDGMTEIAVLAGVILLLALASFLVRRKEREPQEQRRRSDEKES
ncbi:MAG: phosphate-starvation-inducible PsiE family protein [Egibacteraceae bacterium]